MINKLKGKLQSKDNKRLISNFISLAVLQGANYILPLITLPYLVRVLGVDNFGILAFATAVIAYFKIITDYGFNLTATREVSIHRGNKEKIVEIFSSVMTIKVLLTFISFIILCILVFSLEKFNQQWEVYILTFGTVVGQVLFPIWFFQGMERMKYITYLNILAKSIFTIAIFIFVKEKNDFWIVPLLTSIGFISAGVWSIYLINREFKISFSWQKTETIKEYLIDGWHVFQQQFYVGLYGPINIILLGFFTNTVTVGYYSIVEKILAVPLAVFAVSVQAYYPYAVNLFKKSISAYFKQLKFVFIIFALISILATASILFLSGEVVSFITNKSVNAEIVKVLNILVLGLVFTSLGGLYTQVFVTLKEGKLLNKISFRIMLLNLSALPFIIYFFGVEGMAWFVFFRQFILIAVCSVLIHKFKSRFLNNHEWNKA